MIVKVLREEESLYAMTQYVDAVLGKKQTSNNQASIEDIFNDTDHKTQFIFILSQGADSLPSLMRLANQKNVQSEKLRIISLGQGQGIIAEKAIESGVKSGDWEILQNCHLGKSFMPTLEKRLERFEDPELQSQFNTCFRLILTSMPCDCFPVSATSQRFKVKYVQNYTDLSSDQIENCEKKEQWKKLLYSLAFFHAVVQERRKFGPSGWNIRYEFNDSDLETSYTPLRNFLDLPQDAIVYVIREITYGRRVTDDWDRRCLLTIFTKFINENALNDGYSFSDSGVYKQSGLKNFIIFLFCQKFKITHLINQKDYHYDNPIINNQYKIFQLQSSDTNIEGYRNLINNFPDFEKPEVFGMNENANISFKLTESKLALLTILSIQPEKVHKQVIHIKKPKLQMKMF